VVVVVGLGLNQREGMNLKMGLVLNLNKVIGIQKTPDLEIQKAILARNRGELGGCKMVL